MCFQLNVTNMLIRHVVRGHNLIGEGKTRATNSPLYIYIFRANRVETSFDVNSSNTISVNSRLIVLPYVHNWLPVSKP